MVNIIGLFGGKMKFKAFTLAEVLITLGIIGIVAAMTLPALIKNHQRKETEARLKKAYSTISQAFEAAVAKHGDVNYWPEWDDAELILTRYIAPEIKNAKVFPAVDNDTNVMCYEGRHPGGFQKGDEYTQYGWMSKVYISSPFYKNRTASMKLIDGTCIGLNSNETIADKNNSYLKYLFIDTNGSYRAPNMAGMDLFFFIVKDNMIVPNGYNWDTSKLSDPSVANSCHRKAKGGGFVCAARIMGEGWTINYW